MPAEMKVEIPQWREKLFEEFAKPGGEDRPTSEYVELFGCPREAVIRSRKAWRDRGKDLRRVAPGELNLFAGLQLRVAIDEATVAEYAELWKEGEPFPPPVAVDDGSTLFLCDGFHRVHGAMRADLSLIDVEVHRGDRRLALKIAARANVTQKGLRLTRADIRHKVKKLLGDPEWAAMGDYEFAAAAGVDGKTVAKYRAELAREKEGAGAKTGYPGNRPAPKESCNDEAGGDRAGGDGGVVDPALNGHAGTVEDVAGEAVGKEQAERDFLESLPVRARLHGRCLPTFDADALFCRDAIEASAPLRNLLVARSAGMAGSGRKWGAYYSRVESLLKLPHPRGGQRKGDRYESGWLACPDCRDAEGLSTGLTPGRDKLDCPTCRGRGYTIGGGR
jgi:hypothetical protein